MRIAALVPALLLLGWAPATTPRFRDIAAQAGVQPVIVSGGPVKNYVLEVNGSGACWLDYDGDGWQDLFLVNGSTLARLQGKDRTKAPGNHLFRNLGNGKFAETTAQAGVAGNGWGFGCVAADYDNDGRVDLFVTNFGANSLFHNEGNGRFREIAAQAGVAGKNEWHAGAAFGDYDNDGWLDLYVSGYLDFNIGKPEMKNCEYRGVAVKACGPLGYRGAPDALYRNNKDGTFTDVTAEAGVTDKTLYFGFAVIFDDFNGDGRADIFVANDSNPNYLYLNRGDGTFREAGIDSGVAFNADGKEMSSMGVAAGDYNHDGQIDLFVTTFAADNYVLFRNDGRGSFSDVSYPSGVGEATISYLGWGAFFFDYDNDGQPDLLAANGHVYPEVDGKLRETYRQPLNLLRNDGKGRFTEVGPAEGLRTGALRSARGAAYADFDNDGDLDFAVSNMDDRPQLFENRGDPARHWIQIELAGTKSNRGGIGAKVKIEAGGQTQYDHARAGASYLSGNDPRLHFGLGEARRVDRLEVTWPSGATTRAENLEADRWYLVSESGEVTVRRAQGR